MAPQPIGFERPMLEDVRPGAYGPGASSRTREGLSAFLELAADGWRVATRSLDAPQPQPRVIVEIGRDACHIYTDGVMIGARFRPSDAAAIAEAAASAVSFVPQRKRSDALALGFTDDVSLDLELTLPKSRRSTLEQAVAMHAADATPFASGEGLAFWSIRRNGAGDDGSAASHLAEAMITIVPSRAALAILDELRALNLEPRHAVRRGRYMSFASSPDWLAAEPTKAGSSLGAKFAALPAAARTTIVAGAIVLASCAANLAATSFLTSLISDKASAAADTMRRDKRLATDVQFLAARQRETLLKIRVLDEVAARMPDTAYLERLEAKDDILDLTVLAPSAADTLKALATVEGVKAAELQSAVVRDSTRNIERFRLSLTVGAVTPASASGVRP